MGEGRLSQRNPRMLSLLPEVRGVDGGLAGIALELRTDQFLFYYVAVGAGSAELTALSFDIEVADDRGGRYSFEEYAFHSYTPEITMGFLQFAPALAPDAKTLALTLKPHGAGDPIRLDLRIPSLERGAEG